MTTFSYLTLQYGTIFAGINRGRVGRLRLVCTIFGGWWGWGWPHCQDEGLTPQSCRAWRASAWAPQSRWSSAAATCRRRDAWHWASGGQERAADWWWSGGELEQLMEPLDCGRTPWHDRIPLARATAWRSAAMRRTAGPAAASGSWADRHPIPDSRSPRAGSPGSRRRHWRYRRQIPRRWFPSCADAYEGQRDAAVLGERWGCGTVCSGTVHRVTGEPSVPNGRASAWPASGAWPSVAFHWPSSDCWPRRRRQQQRQRRRGRTADRACPHCWPPPGEWRQRRRGRSTRRHRARRRRSSGACPSCGGSGTTPWWCSRADSAGRPVRSDGGGTHSSPCRTPSPGDPAGHGWRRCDSDGPRGQQGSQIHDCRSGSCPDWRGILFGRGKK